jgi:hypothetical protein
MAPKKPFVCVLTMKIGPAETFASLLLVLPAGSCNSAAGARVVHHAAQ